MFARKHQTVFSVMKSFTRIVSDLEAIIETQNHKNGILHEDLAVLEQKIEATDIEIKLASGTASRLNDLLYGPPEKANDDE